MTDEPRSETRRSVLTGLSGAALGVAGVGTGVAADDRAGDPRGQLDDDRSQWIVRVDDGPSRPADAPTVTEARAAAERAQADVVHQLATTTGVDVRTQFWLANAVLVETDDRLETPGTTLTALDDVVDVHSNFIVEAPEPVDRTRLTAQSDEEQTTYGLDQVNATAVWDAFETRGEGTTVAVLDTGVDPEHPDIDLADDGWIQFDDTGQEIDSDPHDPVGHGTHVSGTVTGGDASGSAIGVAPDAELLHAKLGDPYLTFANALAAMEWAVERDADVINTSFGAWGYYDEFVEPIRTAYEHGTVVVSSSGNVGPQSSVTPANVYESVAVGATDEDGAVAEFSSGELVYGPSAWEEPPESWPTWYEVPTVAAPGVDVLSAVPGGGYEQYAGTSMAAPHVTGVVALLRSAVPDRSASEVASIVEAEAVTPGASEPPNTRYGDGIVDGLRCIASAVYDGTLSGAVTDADGDPIPDVEVVTEFGTSDVTDWDGRYEIPVPEGSETVHAIGPFGVGDDTYEVTIDGETSRDVQLERVVDAEIHSEQPVDMAAAQQIELDVSVTALERLEIELTDEATDVDPAQLTVEFAGRTFQPGESVTFDQPIDADEERMTIALGGLGAQAYANGDGLVELQGVQAAIEDWRASEIDLGILQTVIQSWRSDAVVGTDDAVEPASADGAHLAFEHTFKGPGADVVIETGPTTVVEDPDPPTFEIVAPNFDSVVGEDRELQFAPEIENTGDLTGTKTILFDVDLEYGSTFATEARIPPGEREQVELTVSFGQFERGEGEQRIDTGDDTAEGTFDYFDAELHLQAVDAPETATVGEPVSFDLVVENVGELEGGDVIFAFAGHRIDARQLEVPGGETGVVEFELETEGLYPDTYEYEFTTGYFWDQRTIEGELTLEA